MVRIVTLAITLSLVVVAVSAQSVPSQRESPKEVMEHFCKLDAEGRWLGPEHWDEFTRLVTNPKPWDDNLEITVVRSYRVENPTLHGDGAGVEVDYSVWGYIYPNSFAPLRFVRLEGLVSGEPVEKSIPLALVFSDKFMAVRQGKQEEMKGPLQWRIGMDILHPHITVATAIRYVTETRDKTNDPAVKANAERSLVALKSILAGTPEPLHGVTASIESPAHVMRRFAELESRGRGLAPDGWRELAKFFVKPPEPQWNKILVVGDFGYGQAAIEGNKAELVADYVSAGALDSSLRLLHEEETESVAPLSRACCTAEGLVYTFVFSEKHWESAPDGTTKEITGPLAWRIEKYPPEPWITIDTAIRYVTEMRDKTTDPAIKKNADHTLSVLQRLVEPGVKHPGK